jgi:hypothetical protein
MRSDTISAVHAFCPQNSTRYVLRAPLFCDASGDGIVGFMAGAAFRMGAESKEEFGEGFAPDAEYGQLLGHSMYFSTKDVGQPVKFVAPSWALKDITKIPRYRSSTPTCRAAISGGSNTAAASTPSTRPRDQMGALEGGLWRLGLHQELRQTSPRRKP